MDNNRKILMDETSDKIQKLLKGLSIWEAHAILSNLRNKIEIETII